jgi:hypothetical protein
VIENHLRIVYGGVLGAGRGGAELVTTVPTPEGVQSAGSLTFRKTTQGSHDNRVDILLRKPTQGLVPLLKRDYLRSRQGTDRITESR